MLATFKDGKYDEIQRKKQGENNMGNIFEEIDTTIAERDAQAE